MKNCLIPLFFCFILIFYSCEKENTAPTASFVISPASGDDETVFTFDASSSSDLEDDSEDLEVKWDWNSNGTFDTQYSTRKSTVYTFEDAGEYLITLVVKDTRGLTDTLTKALVVESSNLPPGVPANPSPADQSSDLGVNLYFSWECLDPDGDYLLYTVYFGQDPNPVEYLTNYSQNTFDPGKLEYGTTYYWRVNARDSEGNTSEGPLWQCSTIDLNFSELQDLRDGKVYSTIEIGQQWWMAENLNYESPGSSCYNDDIGNCFNYGRLYNWEEANSVCPEGWHLPSLEELQLMLNHLGGSDIAGGILKDYESGRWMTPNTGADNRSGFGALPAGMKYADGLFSGQKYYTHFFTSSEYSEDEAYAVLLAYDNTRAYVYNYKKSYGVSVRCLKDD